MLSGASVRPVAANCDSMAVTPIGVVVPNSVMLDTTVIPKCNRIRLPLEAHAQLGRLDVPIQHLENCVALALLQADNSCREEAVDEKALPPGYRVSPNHRVLGARECLASVVYAVPSPIYMFAVMNCGEAVQQFSHWLRQRLVGEIHVGEQGVAAAIRGHFGQMQDRTHRRLGIARHIGMPVLAGDVLGSLIRPDDKDFGVLRQNARGRGMDVQLAKPTAERLVLLDIELLIAEEDHQTL